jgi:hypothetical protein
MLYYIGMLHYETLEFQHGEARWLALRVHKFPNDMESHILRMSSPNRFILML